MAELAAAVLGAVFAMAMVVLLVAALSPPNRPLEPEFRVRQSLEQVTRGLDSRD